jgi:thiamine monophosphate synthase
MSSNRREFLTTAAAVTGLGTLSLPLAAQGVVNMPTPRASALMALFGLKYPIFSAGMGTTAIPELAIAVSNAGGLGAIGTGGLGAIAIGTGVEVADLVRQRVLRVKSATNRPFAVNFLLAFDPVTLSIALDAGAPIVQFAWGIPTLENVTTIRSAGAKMGIQISSVAGARRALDAGADYLICQGTEAGGHVQATRTLYEVLPAVIDEAKTVPVLAGGGIANGAHIRRALLAGASGVSAVVVKAAHFARPPGLGLDGREHGDNIKVRRGSEYSIRTLQNADEKHGASTDFFNRCTWYLIPSRDFPSAAGEFSDRLMRTGSLDADAEVYAGTRTVLSDVQGLRVGEGFPCLTRAALPSAIVDAAYSLDERQLGLFHISREELRALVRQMSGVR